jgi:hypothetical protein
MNEGAGRGFILIAVAVLIGAVLLGKGLDDTVSTASNEDGSAVTDDDGTGPSDTTTPDSVDSPLSPSSINVLVANGSGVSGAAGSISDRLATAGYMMFPPTDTTTASTETPLDTVYFAQSPNTQAQAIQVATELGLSESAVQPYTDAETVHADMALAQVLVVLGSAPNMLATSGATTSTPTTVA